MSEAILIISPDAEQLGSLVAEAIPEADVTMTRDAGEALERYSGQSVLFGSPVSIAEVLPHVPAVKWVQSSWAGVKPLIALDRRDYVLTGIKDVFGPQMSDYVIGYLLAHELKIVRRLDEQRAHRWWAGASGTLVGKRMGIMGTGSIGRTIAERARAFGVSVIGLSRSGRGMADFDRVYALEAFTEFLEDLDYVVAVLPDTPQTTDLLNAETLPLLPAHAVFINVGRANVVDHDALVAALHAGTLGAAILDVFDQEPLPQDSPLWDAPNLSITAHIAAFSHPELIVPIFLDNYRRYSAGLNLLDIVDFERGY
jgi:phosphoglycerate dehydrogenase-like enzyme